jgi:hypothetical protein
MVDVPTVLAISLGPGGKRSHFAGDEGIGHDQR